MGGSSLSNPLTPKTSPSSRLLPSAATRGNTRRSAASKPHARTVETPLDKQVRIPLPEGKEQLLTRRQILYGALGIGALAAVGVGASAISSVQKEQESVDTLEVPVDAVFTLSDTAETEAPFALSGEYKMPYGTLVWANSDSYAACLIPTESAAPLTNVAILPLGSGDYRTVLEGPVTNGRGFDIYDVRCNDAGIVWTEANCLSGEWRIYQATHSQGSIGSPVQVDQGNANYDVPFIAVAGNRAFWQVMPNPAGEAATEDSLLKSASFGSSDVREDWRSSGRMCTPPYSTRNGIVITPRVDTAGVYHQLTLIDADTGSLQDSLVLPASMKPLGAGYVEGRFTFSFDSIYNYGEGIANLGTYAPVDAGGASGDEWFRFDRNPTAAPAWMGSNLIVKSTRTVAGVDLAARTMFTFDCPDGCDSYGDYLASTGNASRIVTYLGMPGTDGDQDTAYTLVRVWA